MRPRYPSSPPTSSLKSQPSNVFAHKNEKTTVVLIHFVPKRRSFLKLFFFEKRLSFWLKKPNTTVVFSVCMKSLSFVSSQLDYSCHHMFCLSLQKYSRAGYIYPDHKFPQIITLHEDWNDGYNVSVKLKWRIWCFPKATITLLSFFWNFFLKEFICIPAQILEPGIYPARELYFFKICDLGIYPAREYANENRQTFL